MSTNLLFYKVNLSPNHRFRKILYRTQLCLCSLRRVALLKAQTRDPLSNKRPSSLKTHYFRSRWSRQMWLKDISHLTSIKTLLLRRSNRHLRNLLGAELQTQVTPTVSQEFRHLTWATKISGKIKFKKHKMETTQQFIPQCLVPKSNQGCNHVSEKKWWHKDVESWQHFKNHRLRQTLSH